MSLAAAALTFSSAAKADGKVTARERQRLQGEADRDSARIYRQRHDRRTRS